MHIISATHSLNAVSSSPADRPTPTAVRGPGSPRINATPGSSSRRYRNLMQPLQL